jgi:decaprenyl-phosphate phosphoribosyltransferase
VTDALDDAVAVPARRRPSTALALLRGTRPRQWLKNLLVVAAPLAAGVLLTSPALGHTAVAFVGFSLVSAAIYLVNDVLDAPNDRLHPTKRLRPVAAGDLAPATALLAAVVLGAAGLALGVGLVSWRLGLVYACYIAATLTYALGVKRVAVFELALVAAGFVLRAIAGAVAADVELSEWFVLVASFGSLFMVAGKRYADVLHAGSDSGQGWAVVGYTGSYLRFVWSLAATATILGYALWAFQVGAAKGDTVWAQVSVAPFTLAVLRYAVVVDRGEAGTPEDVAFTDPTLVVLGLLWAVSFAIASDVG